MPTKESTMPTSNIKAVIPSSTPTLPETKTPIPTPTATIVISTQTLYLTPLPTLSIEQERVRFYRLYNFIDGCRLPCLWGITPGVTTWTEMKQFIDQFYSFHHIEKVEWSITKSDKFDTYSWAVKQPNSGLDYSPAIFLEVKNNLVTAILIDGELSTLFFPLNRLLSEYGQPDRILLNATTNKGDVTVYLTDVMLVYDDEYIFSSYQFNEFESTNDTTRRVCLNDVQYEPMILLSSGQELNEDFSIWKPISEHSEHTTKTFYERFRYRGNKCFEVSRDAWN